VRGAIKSSIKSSAIAATKFTIAIVTTIAASIAMALAPTSTSTITNASTYTYTIAGSYTYPIAGSYTYTITGSYTYTIAGSYTSSPRYRHFPMVEPHPIISLSRSTCLECLYHLDMAHRSSNNQRRLPIIHPPVHIDPALKLWGAWVVLVPSTKWGSGSESKKRQDAGARQGMGQRLYTGPPTARRWTHQQHVLSTQ
jgi:hypothetical protein